MRFIRDPSTGRRVSRMNPEAQWVRHGCPELRVVDAATWDAVQRRLGELRCKAGADAPGRDRYWERRRAVHLLTHKVHCGRCGGAMSNIGRDYLACAAARRQGVCTSTRGIRRQVLDRLILDALRDRMMDPALFAEFSQAFVEEWNRAVAEADAGRDGLVRELARVERRLHGLIEAVSEASAQQGCSSRWRCWKLSASSSRPSWQRPR